MGGGYLDGLSTQPNLRSDSGALCSGCLTKMGHRSTPKSLPQYVRCESDPVSAGFLLGQIRGEIVPCRFCGGLDGDGHCFLGLSVSSTCMSAGIPKVRQTYLS